MSFWRSSRRPLGLSLPAMMLAAAVLVGAPLDTHAAAPTEPGSGGRARNYIVTLDVPDAGRAIRPTGQTARQRIRRRAARTEAATDRLARVHAIRPRHRYEAAVSGFSAWLTPQQVARLRRDRDVTSVRPARRVRLAAQTTPTGVRRVKSAIAGLNGVDVDADIAILDTGIGPVGGGELDVRGGINCSGDGLPDDDYQDRHSSRHGTHVAGIAAARDNVLGVVGVAPGARLWSVRVFRGSGFGDESTIICGLDWAVSTHGPGAPPGSQPVEVINMSIQGPRVSQPQEACGAGADPDPMHVAVCAAYAANITLVAAAGNDRRDAAGVTPAGYDQVVTVAALSDFDGTGGGLADSACSAFRGEDDDRYASYSNFGNDIDILAPGTCIRSTTPSASGTSTRVLSGTSMAAPHVTGAVARYLADHPATTPAQMRKLIRAAGRLDWSLTSDPTWSGPNDSDAPERVLDVSALLGGQGLRTWVYPPGYRIGPGIVARNVRVDVQRMGGYSDMVQLGTEGLPAAIGSASFDRPGADLDGLGGLGARLRLAIAPAGPDGRLDVSVTSTGAGGDPSDSSALDLVLDRTGPVVTNRPVKIRAGRRDVARGGLVDILVLWHSEDELSRVKHDRPQRRIASGPWRLFGRNTKSSMAAATVKAGRHYRFRVRSTDTLGNRTLGPALPVHLTMRDSGSSRWLQPAGGWVRRTSRAALGRSVLQTRGRGHSLTTSFAGTAMAIVAPIGPRLGVLRVRVDGGPWKRISLRSRADRARRVVFSRRYEPGDHVLEIRVVRGSVAIDAILVVE